MPRLIDAEQFYKELAELYQDIGWDERDNHISLADIKCNLGLMPTVDPVRHGHWVDEGEKYLPIYCSCCGFGKIYEDQRNYAYCPNCGARMDEEREDAE